MKTITMYELLGLVKDGKAPKKVKYENEILYYDEETKDYFNDEDMHPLFAGVNTILDDEVEILEEEKKIPEKEDELIRYNIQDFDNLKEFVEITTNDLFGKVNKVIDKLNGVIDYLKSKGE